MLVKCHDSLIFSLYNYAEIPRSNIETPGLKSGLQNCARTSDHSSFGSLVQPLELVLVLVTTSRGIGLILESRLECQRIEACATPISYSACRQTPHRIYQGCSKRGRWLNLLTEIAVLRAQSEYIKQHTERFCKGLGEVEHFLFECALHHGFKATPL